MDNFTTGGAKHGIEPALSYYTTHGTPYFALYIGKPTARHGNVMMHNWKGRIEEVEEAAQHIRERFMDTGIDSRTRYTLAWWDERPKMTKGTPDEAPSGSVVFVCATEEQISGRIEGYRERIGYVNNEIVSRLAAIEARLQKEEEDDDEEEEQQPEQSAVLGALMQNPAVVNTIQTLLMRIADGVVPAPVPVASKLAGVEDPVEFDTEKLNRALVILKRADPNLEDDLLKLARMAEDNPKQFAWLLKML
jgi:hypothetical protein